jgi:hypothetical protein
MTNARVFWIKNWHILNILRRLKAERQVLKIWNVLEGRFRFFISLLLMSYLQVRVSENAPKAYSL